MKRSYATIPAGQVHYAEEGNGPPVLLLHQVPSWSKEYEALAQPLSSYFRVIAMDHMGYGMSGPRNGFYQVAEFARDVKDFLAAIGVKRCHIFGQHTGATVGVETAARFPAFVDRMFLSGCPHYTKEMRDARLKTGAFAPPVIMADGSHLMNAWNTIKKYTPGSTPKMVNDMLIGRLLAGERGEEGHQAVLQYDIEARLPLVKAPTMFFSAQGDVFVNSVPLLSSLVKGSRTRVELGDGLITLTNPAMLAAAMLEFLKSS
jgi:pimeloyl-ACP methyl ester carboxylesterase